MSLNNIIYNCIKFQAYLDYEWKLRLLQHEMDMLPKIKTDKKTFQWKNKLTNSKSK